jgi:hypothetical protein
MVSSHEHYAARTWERPPGVHTWTRAASLNADQAYVIDRKIISWSGVVQLWRRRVVKYERRKRSGEKRNPILLPNR